MSAEQRARRALLRVAENVAKHTVQRSGWSADDECFNVDLRESERELQDAIREAGEREAILRTLRLLRDERAEQAVAERHRGLNGLRGHEGQVMSFVLSQCCVSLAIIVLVVWLVFRDA